MELKNNILDSLKNDNSGFSFRKIMALLGFILVVYLHIHYLDTTTVLTALLYDLVFILSLLGLINLDKFISEKYGSKKDTPNEPNKGEV